MPELDENLDKSNKEARAAAPTESKSLALGPEYLEAYTKVGLDNLRATSRTVIDGNIDVSAADSPIPNSCKAALESYHNAHPPKVAPGAKAPPVGIPPLSKEAFSELNLSPEQLADLKKSNEKIDALDVNSLVSKSKEDIKKQVAENYVAAMSHAYTKAAGTPPFSDANQVRDFIKTIALTLGNGIIDPAHWLRHHDSEKFKVYTRVADIEKQLDMFSAEFLQKLNDLLTIDDKDERLREAKKLAGWVEYRINLTDHFLADSCGKTAALVANLVYMAAGISPEDMPIINRSGYFNKHVVPETRLGTDPKREQAELERWQRHYESAFFTPTNQKDKEIGPWDIPSPTVNQYLKAAETGKYILPMDAQFTNLRNAIRDESMIGEIASAVGESNIQKLITYRLDRLALFETTAITETEVKLKSEEDLPKTVQQIYRNSVKPVVAKLIKEEQAKMLSESRQEAEKAFDKSSPYNNLLEDTYATILKRYESGEYKYPAHVNMVMDVNGNPITDVKLALWEIATMYVADKIYQAKAEKFITEKIEPVIQAGIDAAGLSRLSLHNGENRHTFMMAGPPACGKGTAIATVKLQATDKLGVNWDDIVKINTDIHREIVSNAANTGARREYSGTLNNAEASYITDRAYARLEAKAKSKQGAPHMLIDGVNISEDRLKLGTEGNGSLHIAVVTVPADVSVKRAFDRGQSDGRFVPPSYSLMKHREVSQGVFTNLMKVAGTNTDVVLYNTDVPRGSRPITVMVADMKAQTATVYDSTRMAEFYGKTNIDITAQKPAQIFLLPQDRLRHDYELQMTAAGFKKVEFKQQKDLDPAVTAIAAPAKTTPSIATATATMFGAGAAKRKREPSPAPLAAQEQTETPKLKGK